MAAMDHEPFDEADVQLPVLARELAIYHRRHRPHDRANLIIKIVRWV